MANRLVFHREFVIENGDGVRNEFVQPLYKENYFFWGWIWFLEEWRILQVHRLVTSFERKDAGFLIKRKENSGEFIANHGWLSRYKNRLIIHFAQGSREKMSADNNSGPIKFKTKFGKARLDLYTLRFFNET